MLSCSLEQITRLSPTARLCGARIKWVNAVASPNLKTRFFGDSTSNSNPKEDYQFFVLSRPFSTTMPHSVSQEDTSTPGQDTIVADVETNNGETQTTEDTMTADAATSNGDSQASDAMDQDMTMADAGVEGDEILQVAVKAEEKPEVKLEDLFADMESDEEFPSSNIKDIKVSSSPEAPPSPV